MDQELGLNTYDYSARYFDPALPRFTTVDSKAEKYYPISPYVYVANNPIKFVDPDGRNIWDVLVGAAQAIVDNLTIGLINDIGEERRA